MSMPTGSGKTAVIAALAHQAPFTDVLLLSPWSALREQLADELRTTLWTKVRYPFPHGPKPVEQFTPGTVDEALKQPRGTVFTATFQTWQALHREDIQAFRTLAARKMSTESGTREKSSEPARAESRGLRVTRRDRELLAMTAITRYLSSRTGPIVFSRDGQEAACHIRLLQLVGLEKLISRRHISDDCAFAHSRANGSPPGLPAYVVT